MTISPLRGPPKGKSLSKLGKFLMLPLFSLNKSGVIPGKAFKDNHKAYLV
jgi:hypothetical protein